MECTTSLIYSFGETPGWEKGEAFAAGAAYNHLNALDCYSMKWGEGHLFGLSQGLGQSQRASGG
jgi:hypothetical protein